MGHSPVASPTRMFVIWQVSLFTLLLADSKLHINPQLFSSKEALSVCPQESISLQVMSLYIQCHRRTGLLLCLIQGSSSRVPFCIWRTIIHSLTHLWNQFHLLLPPLLTNYQVGHSSPPVHAVCMRAKFKDHKASLVFLRKKGRPGYHNSRSTIPRGLSGSIPATPRNCSYRSHLRGQQ